MSRWSPDRRARDRDLGGNRMTEHRAPRRRWWPTLRPVIRYTSPTGLHIEITGHRHGAALRLFDAIVERVPTEVRPWRPEDGDTRCQRCGRPNPVWLVDDATWNAVMGDEGGVLCPLCFIAKAEESGLRPTTWRVTPHPPAPPPRFAPLPDPVIPST